MDDPNDDQSAVDANLNLEWIEELKKALSNDCDFGTLRNISNGRTLTDECRSNAWKICLNVQGKADSLSAFDGFYNMDNQALRADCVEIVDKLGNEEEDKVSVISDLESIVTFYCKSLNTTYSTKSLWLEVLQILLSLKMPRSDTYNCFYSLMNKYIPRDSSENSKSFHLFRLLLQYHDPQLCSYLDTMKVYPHVYCYSWFQSLLASSCDLNVTLFIWDVYFQHADPFLIFFLTLVIVINAKDRIMSYDEDCDSKEKIISFISSIPSDLSPEDIEDFCSLAQYYATKTPQSFRRDFQSTLFSNENPTETDEENSRSVPVCEALCLPVSVSELLQANQLGSGDCVRYFVVDCRPADQYNSGHLPTAFHLDAHLMLRNPDEFDTAIRALFSAQTQALASGSVAGGEHLCFMGSGREEEDQYMFMVVANFLQKHQQYVSITRGGYADLHKELIDSLDSDLADHRPEQCLHCYHSFSNNNSSPVPSMKRDETLFSKLTDAVITKSAEFKEKVEKITNAIKTDSPLKERHVESNLTGFKVYRNTANVFSIDDDDDDDGVTGVSFMGQDMHEVVNISTWLQKPDIMYSCQCQHIDDRVLYPSYIMMTASHLYVLRELLAQKGMAHIVCRRNLVSVMKITSKRKHPELISLKYGTNDENGLEIVDQDRFIIAKAGEATKAIKYQIIKLLDSLDVTS